MLKDSYYFPHFMNAHADPKIRRLEKQYGNDGYAAYFKTLEVLRGEVGYQYLISDLDLLSEQINVDEKVLDYMINKTELFVKKDGYFTSLKMHEFMKPWEERSQRAKDAANKRWQAAKEQEDDLEEIPAKPCLPVAPYVSTEEALHQELPDLPIRKPNPRQKNPQETKINLDAYIDYWNNYSDVLPECRKNSTQLKDIQEIYDHVKLFTTTEVCQAILNYADITKSEIHKPFPVYTNIDGFLKSGVEKYFQKEQAMTRCRDLKAEEEYISPEQKARNEETIQRLAKREADYLAKKALEQAEAAL